MKDIKYMTLNRYDNFTSNIGELSYSEITEKKSKFISYIFNISNKEKAIEYLNKVKKIHFQAKHIVYIYSYLENNLPTIKFCDDGEPKGTGTKAIYELITKENLTNICIIVVRYFGGTLLGTGLLSRTYLNCARESILKCHKDVIYTYINISLTLTYNEYNNIKYILDNEKKEGNISNISIKYNDLININMKIKDIEKDRIEGNIKSILK